MNITNVRCLNGRPSRLFPATYTLLHSEPKVGRNDPCPCGSGKKFKKCCLSKAEQVRNYIDDAHVQEFLKEQMKKPNGVK